MSALQEHAVALANDTGRLIRCDVRTPAGDGPFPVVVILHGFKGFKDWGMFPPTARSLAERGLATVAMNASMNGVGESLEEFTELEAFAQNTPRREALDVRTVLDAIEDGTLAPSLDPARVGLLGHSRGGGVVVLVAGNDPRVRCLVTWASPSTFQRYTPRAREEWRRQGRLEIPNLRTGQIMWFDREVLEDLEARADEYDLEKLLAHVDIPFLAVHGERDEAVAVEESEQLIAWTRSEHKKLHVVARTGHTFGAAHPWAGSTPAWQEAVDETASWFQAHLAG